MFWAGRICSPLFFFDFFFLRTHTACYKHKAASCLIYLSTRTGVRTGCNYFMSLSVCVCACCVSFDVVNDCGSCTRPISTNPGSMEADQCGLTRGACFAARCLEFVAVAGRLWITWRVFGEAGCFFSFSSNAHGLLQVRGHTLPPY